MASNTVDQWWDEVKARYAADEGQKRVINCGAWPTGDGRVLVRLGPRMFLVVDISMDQLWDHVGRRGHQARAAALGPLKVAVK
jgi:hypothetical protein